MRQRRIGRIGLLGMMWIGLAGSAWVAADAVAAPPKASAKGALAPPPMAKEAIRLLPEGFRLGMSMAEVFDFYDKVLDQDHSPLYKRVQPGPQMIALDAELADRKAAFRRGVVEFGDLPTGIDQTALKGEYSYKDSEAMASLNRGGMTRYFFFVSKRLWKVYDEVPLKAGGDLGGTYQEAIVALQKRYGVGGRVLAADPGQGRRTTEVDWADATSHVRALDRSQQGLVGLVTEERITAIKMASLRASQGKDEGAVDPLIQMVTRGNDGGAPDPNASAADSYTGKTHAGDQPQSKPRR
jgi:hypothetical protein